MRHVLLLVLLLTTGLGGCAIDRGAAPAAGATLHGDAARPAAAQWRRTELYFSIGAFDLPPDQAAAALQRWQQFLDREVTPRFPDGLSVIDAYGQWMPRGGSVQQRLRSKVLVILHEDTPARSADIDAIRAAYKQLTGELSVLRVSEPVDVSF